MKAILLIAATAGLWMTGWAVRSGPVEASGGQAGDPERLAAGYRGFAYAEATPIPDNQPSGVTIGPLEIAGDCRAIHDLILCIEISHAYVGDLGIWLHYDSNRDGDFEVSTPIESHLARPQSWRHGELCGCPIEYEGVYYFKDEGWREAGEVASFRVFEGLPAGGVFYLTVVDTGDGNTGTISTWAVYTERFGGRGASSPNVDVL